MLEESEISEHCFDLIFAFDEIVALGYRENVNLAQIRTFTEMDSHEEKVFRAVREVRYSLKFNEISRAKLLSDLSLNWTNSNFFRFLSIIHCNRPKKEKQRLRWNASLKSCSEQDKMLNVPERNRQASEVLEVQEWAASHQPPSSLIQSSQRSPKWLLLQSGMSCNRGLWYI